MASNYERIRDANVKEYGEGTRHLAFLGRLYSDRTHFIYELLQNAEDAEAGALEFHLWPDRVEIYHDGRLFTEADVRGICGVGEGTKVEDLTQIGRFGVGFKSVYAYVKNPEIHSGDEHFRIDHYVRPEAAKPRIPPSGFTTTFLLPFAGSPAQANDAFREIETAFRKLSSTTLLFLRRIKSVRVSVNGAFVFQIVRTVQGEPTAAMRRVEIQGIRIEGTKTTQEGWLVFSDPFTLKREDGSEVTLPVELAFRLKRDGSNQHYSIEAERNAPLFAFFPTQMQTNLGFLIQGPYRTTPARDNVPASDPINRDLIQATSNLVVRALRDLKSQKLLTVRVLETLPIDEDHFPSESMLRPIYESVRTALRNEELLPLHSPDADKTQFGSGSSVKAARSTELRQLVTSEQLSKLNGTSSPLFWLSADITADKTSRLWSYLRQEISIEEIDPESFVRKLNKDFLESQSDQWIARLYGFFGGQRSWVSGNKMTAPFASKPIIRLEDGRHEKPFKEDGSPTAFFSTNIEGRFTCVRHTITEYRDARDFLASLGYAIPDMCDTVVQTVLPRYASGAIPDDKTYFRDLECIFAGMKTDSFVKRQMLQGKLKGLRFVRARNASTGKLALKLPTEIYIPSSDLSLFFCGNPDAWFLDSTLDEHRRQIKDLGSSDEVRIIYRRADGDGYVVLRHDRGDHERGIDGFDPECHVEGLKYALENPTADRVAFIWNSILKPNSKMIRGQVELSSRKDFLSPSLQSSFSHMGKLASQLPWIPSSDGKFKRPSEISLNELPPTFRKDEDLARALKLRPPASQSEEALIAAKLGVSLEHIDFLKKHKSEFEKFMRSTSEMQAKPKAPEAEPGNPSRRAIRVAEEATNASFIERLKFERQVRVNWQVVKAARTKLRDWQTNIDHQLVCQICQDEMPFKLNDETHYFEAVQCVKEVNRELPENYLALCPVCSAKFRYANRMPAGEIKNRVLSTKNKLHISINLAGHECDISFTKTHLSDLQNALASDAKK